jgi:NAD(P)-dependent dehydrogenase (short-subunit alcohol dehydrogenase family)
MERLDSFDLTDKVTLITGAARGIGKAIATQFAAKGAKLILLDMSDEVMQVGQSFSKALAIQSDVTDETQVNQAIHQSIDQFGRIDILVNNAGVVRLSPAETHSNEDQRYEGGNSCSLFLSAYTGIHLV